MKKNLLVLIGIVAILSACGKNEPKGSSDEKAKADSTKTSQVIDSAEILLASR